MNIADLSDKKSEMLDNKLSLVEEDILILNDYKTELIFSINLEWS